MTEEQRLIEKLRRIEALFARPGTEGEREAASRARERILGKLRAAEVRDPAVEYRFSLPDAWSRRLLIALLQRYGIRPYRHRGQRRTTIMARVSKAFVDETLWPQFEALQGPMAAHFDAIAARVIAEAIGASVGDAEER